MLAADLKTLLDRALKAECGISIKFSTSETARYQRRRLYAERERLRQNGHHDYDDLSLLIRNNNQILIVKRNAIPKLNEAKFQDCRELRIDELPKKILSRGKSRWGISIS